jgi:hypothetical protein
MSARFTFLLALVVLGASRSVLSADSGTPPFAPEKYDIGRYKKIWDRSPFIVETVVVQQSVGLASKYALVGLVQSGNESVAFLDDSGKTVMISKKRPDRERNLELISITADKDFRKSKVTIKQGAEQAELPFDPRGAVAMGGSASIDPGVQQPTVVPPTQPGATSHQLGAAPAQQPPPSPGAAPAVNGAPGTTRRIISPGTPVVPAAPGTLTAPNAYSPPVANTPGEQAPPTTTRRIIRPKPIDVTT